MQARQLIERVVAITSVGVQRIRFEQTILIVVAQRDNGHLTNPGEFAYLEHHMFFHQCKHTLSGKMRVKRYGCDSNDKQKCEFSEKSIRWREAFFPRHSYRA